MTPEQWRRVNDLYHAALDAPVDQRGTFVQDHASGDTTVARELQRLLEIDPDKTAAVDKPAGNLASLMVPTIAPGDNIANRYRILGEVGAGGMGQVYEAIDDELKTRVALKIIRPELANEPRVVARFKQEVQLARQVTHPNVCRAYDLVRVEHRQRELLILCMEFVDGETLSTKLRRDGKMKIAEAEPIIQQIAAGLDAAHAAGVVHRDLKSGNIFLSKTRDGELRVVLADFGLAGQSSPSEAATRQTTSGWGIGTPAYMSPEQVEGGKIGPAADIYALGVVMYEMSTGHVPYEGQTPLQVAVRRLREKPRPPRELDPSIDGKWESAILRCLEVEPADRFANAGAAAQALHQAGWLPRTPNRLWRRRAAAAAAIAIVAAGAGVYWARSRQPNIPPEALSWYNRGLAVLYDGDWTGAEKAFTQAIQAAPSFGAAYARRAEAQVEMDRIDDARASLLEGVDAGNLTPDQKQHLDAVRAYLNRAIDKAEKILAERAKSETEGVIAKLDYARALMRRTKYREALEPYRAIVAKDPGLASAWIQLARAAYSDGKTDEAAQAFNHAADTLQQFPNPGTSKDLAFYRADAARQQNRPDRDTLTQEALRLAASPIDFRNIRARLFQANLQLRAGRFDAAMAEIAAATDDARKNGLDLWVAQGLSDLGFERLTQGEFEQGSELMRESIKIAEKLGAQRTLAKAQVDLGYYLANGCKPDRLPEAQSLTQKVITLANRSELLDIRVEAQENLVKLRICERDLAGAEAAGQAYLGDAQRLPDRAHLPDAYNRLSDVSRLRLRLRESRDRAEQASRIACDLGYSSRCFELRLNLARTDFNLGDYPAALAAFDQLESQGTPAQRMSVRRSRAVLFSEQGQPDKANVLLKEVRASRQGKPDASLDYLQCLVDAEAHNLPSARRSCMLLIDDARMAPALRNAARVLLAQALFWSGDYAGARNMAHERAFGAAQLSALDRLPALLVVAAVDHKTGVRVSRAEQEVRQSIDELRHQNGASDAARYLQKRPLRELLSVIGNANLN